MDAASRRFVHVSALGRHALSCKQRQRTIAIDRGLDDRDSPEPGERIAVDGLGDGDVSPVHPAVPVRVERRSGGQGRLGGVGRRR